MYLAGESGGGLDGDFDEAELLAAQEFAWGGFDDVGSVDDGGNGGGSGGVVGVDNDIVNGVGGGGGGGGRKDEAVPLSFDQHGRQHYKGLYEVPALDELESFTENANHPVQIHTQQAFNPNVGVVATTLNTTQGDAAVIQHTQQQYSQALGSCQQPAYYVATTTTAANAAAAMHDDSQPKVSVDTYGRQHYKGLYDTTALEQQQPQAQVNGAGAVAFAAPSRPVVGARAAQEAEFSSAPAPVANNATDSYARHAPNHHLSPPPQQQQHAGVYQVVGQLPAPPPPGMYYAPYVPSAAGQNGPAPNGWVLQSQPPPAQQYPHPIHAPAHQQTNINNSATPVGYHASVQYAPAPVSSQVQQQQQQLEQPQFNQVQVVDQQSRVQHASSHMTVNTAPVVAHHASESASASLAGRDLNASQVVGGRAQKQTRASHAKQTNARTTDKPTLATGGYAPTSTMHTTTPRAAGAAASSATNVQSMQNMQAPMQNMQMHANKSETQSARTGQNNEEEELMRSMGSKKPKIRRYANTEASKFCHVCARSMDTVRAISCFNTVFGVCRKIVCEKCFQQNGWDWDAASKPGARWACIHCKGICPERAQCNTYKRTNQRRRLKGMQKRKELEQMLLASGADSISGLIEPTHTNVNNNNPPLAQSDAGI
mmetsp:Transcript_10494/g.22190  ORF Transcript_10494/g.22190 Transcript_10494/m.22190 type:complete len:654 (+) Transcript_10494:86-2047(+)